MFWVAPAPKGRLGVSAREPALVDHHCSRTGAWRYNTGHTTQEGRAARRRGLLAGGAEGGTARREGDGGGKNQAHIASPNDFRSRSLGYLFGTFFTSPSDLPTAAARLQGAPAQHGARVGGASAHYRRGPCFFPARLCESLFLNTKKRLCQVHTFVKLKQLCAHSLLSCQAPLLRPAQLSAQSRASQSKRACTECIVTR